MTIRTLLKWRNLDLSADINDRYVGLIAPGVFEGGNVVIVPAQLRVDLLPFKMVSYDGMVVEETSDSYRLDTPAGQTTVIACKAKYIQNAPPEVDVVGLELSAFNALSDIELYVVFAHVTVPLFATETLSSYIDFTPRASLDQLARSRFRGRLSSTAALPSSQFNLPGDFFMVVDGIGGLPQLYGWDGTQWVSMTDAATVTADLSAHRQNLFVDEKHLTDSEKLAVVGTSGTPVSGSNKLVDSADTRIPTQSENDALVGTDGSPSSSNRYVTELYPLAVPQEKAIGPGGTSANLLSNEGPFYVGLDGTGTSVQYFKFFNATEPRELLNSTGVQVEVQEVYTDSGLTLPLNPSINPNVDADGFFTGDLYVKFTVVPDVGYRLGFGRRRTFKDMPVDALLRRSVNDAQSSAELVSVIEAIKGRSFDTVPPVNEQNIELRKDVVDLKEYVSTVFNADYVAFDFSKMDAVPDFGSDFVPNVGIPQSYTYQNTGLVTFSYTAATGTVTFASPVLGSVVAGNVFIDGSGIEFPIQSVPTTSTLTIQTRDGTVPSSINTTISTSLHGSCKPDNNPRKINLSTLDVLGGRDRILIREIESVPNEFFPPTGNVAYQVRKPLRSPFYREPRIRLYGGFENRSFDGLARVVATSTGTILITGFFTDLVMLCRLTSTSPSVTVRTDGSPSGTVIDLSRSATIAPVDTEADLAMRQVVLVTGLTDLVPHTVRIDVANASSDFVLYGFDLSRFSNSTVDVLPGRAFVQSDLYKSDTISSYTPVTLTSLSRGAVATRFVNRSLAQQTTVYSLADFDGASSIPAGTAVSGSPNFTVTSGLAKFVSYKVGDVVKLVTASVEETLRILSIGPGVGQVTFTSNVSGSGAATLIHMASTSGQPVDPTAEYARYSVQDLPGFSSLFLTPTDKVYTVEDGVTTIAAKNVRFSTTGIDGASIALELIDGTSTLTIRALASQLDVLVVNSTNVNASIAIDGSPTFAQVITASGMTRFTVWTNARYQTHEMTISAAAGLRIVGFILHEPTLSSPVEGAALATRNVIARYGSSLSQSGSVIPTGSVGIDPYIGGGVFVNGTGVGSTWSYAVDFSINAAWGRYLTTSLEGSYFEYVFTGVGFEVEHLALFTYGRPIVLLNGVIANSTNFPAASFKGVTALTGELDMYDPALSPVRKKASITNLTYGRYTLRIQVQTPRQRNPSSSGFDINVGVFYVINADGRLAVTPSRGFRDGDFSFGLESQRDERNFDSGAVAREQVPVLRTIMPPVQVRRVPLAIATTTVNVVFAEPFEDTDYAVTCTMVNTVDGSPSIQAVVISAFSTTGFTAEWASPLATGNYFLNYVAVKFA